jgi:hypothetical protein
VIANRVRTIAYRLTTGFVTGDGAAEIVVPLVFAVVTAASWLLRPESRTLGVILPSRREAASLRLEARPAA